MINKIASFLKDFVAWLASAPTNRNAIYKWRPVLVMLLGPLYVMRTSLWETFRELGKHSNSRQLVGYVLRAIIAVACVVIGWQVSRLVEVTVQGAVLQYFASGFALFGLGLIIDAIYTWGRENRQSSVYNMQGATSFWQEWVLEVAKATIALPLFYMTMMVFMLLALFGIKLPAI